MKVTATIQARMGSSRLPGKVLMDICGKPMLLWQVERIRRARLVDEIIIATTLSESDNEIETFCKKNNIRFFRGSENDVLDRISRLISERNIDIHLECYGDSPFIDPQIIDENIGFYLKKNIPNGYFSSSLETTYPPGMEVTIYRGNMLTEVNNLIPKNDPLREHVGYNITRFKDKFPLISVKAQDYLHNPEVYLEVDTKEDIELLRVITKHFLEINKNHFSLIEIINFLNKNKNLIEKNKFVERRWKNFRK